MAISRKGVCKKSCVVKQHEGTRSANRRRRAEPIKVLFLDTRGQPEEKGSISLLGVVKWLLVYNKKRNKKDVAGGA